MEKYIGKYSVKDFLYLILGAFIYSIGTHSFIETANIAPGGAVGVALMLNHVTNLPVGRLTLMVNVPLLIPLRCGRRLRAESVRLCLTT